MHRGARRACQSGAQPNRCRNEPIANVPPHGDTVAVRCFSLRRLPVRAAARQTVGWDASVAGWGVKLGAERDVTKIFLPPTAFTAHPSLPGVHERPRSIILSLGT